jgi:hypothetical protein
MRLNDGEYKYLIDEIITSRDMNDRLLVKLSKFHMEYDARCLEAIMDKRSSRSARASLLPKVVHELEEKFNCRLIYRNGKVGTIIGHYELHEASYNHWDWVGK